MTESPPLPISLTRRLSFNGEGEGEGGGGILDTEAIGRRGCVPAYLLTTAKGFTLTGTGCRGTPPTWTQQSGALAIPEGSLSLNSAGCSSVS